MASKRRSNGEGTAYWDTDRGCFAGQITLVGPDGRPKRKKARGKTEAEVRKKLQQIRRDYEAGALNLNRAMTIDQYIDHWIADVLPALDIKESTRAQYSYICRHYVSPTWGSKKLVNLRVAEVDAGLRKLVDQGLRHGTVRHAKVSLGMLLREAKREELIAYNVVDDARLPRVERARERRAMTDDQIAKLIESTIGTRMHGPVVIGLTTGLRLGEFLNLRWSDLDLDSPSPCLRVTESKTSAGRRVVALTTYAVKVLRDQRKQNIITGRDVGEMWSDEGYVFPSSKGSRWDDSNFRKLFKAACIDAGIGEWIPHEMRHTAATWLLTEEVELKKVSDQLGHANISTTVDIYGHVIRQSGEIRRAFEKMTPAVGVI